MNEWLPFVKEVGLPIALVVAFLLFLWKGFWPFMVKQIDEARTARREDAQMFAEALKRVTDENTAGMKQVAEKLEGLTNEVRSGRR